MPRIGRMVLVGIGALTVFGTATATARHAAPDAAASRQYLVLHRIGAFVPTAGLRAVGAQVVRDNAGVGVTVVRGRPGLRAVLLRTPGVQGLVPDRSGPRPALHRVATGGPTARAASKAPPVPEPLEPLQWHLDTVRAATAGLRTFGRADVTVAVIDGGVDGSHPDLAPVLDAGASRSFATGEPTVDVDGHGTHLAATVAAARNGVGGAGVAPGVRLVSLRVTDERGAVTLAPLIDALTHAGDTGVDVALVGTPVTVPGDDCGGSDAARQVRATALHAVQRAVDRARWRGVTVVTGVGDTRTDLDAEPHCANLPAEAARVVTVGATGPGGRKPEYASWGARVVALSAPGGDRHDFPDDPFRSMAPENMVLGAYPTAAAVARGQLDGAGVPLDPVVVRSCPGGACAYYRWSQGSAVAAAQVAGAAALVVSRYGRPQRDGAGWTMGPGDVAVRLRRTVAPNPCPAPPVFSYPDIPDAPPVTCTADGPRTNTGGDGLLDAAAAVGVPRSAP